MPFWVNQKFWILITLQIIAICFQLRSGGGRGRKLRGPGEITRARGGRWPGGRRHCWIQASWPPLAVLPMSTLECCGSRAWDVTAAGLETRNAHGRSGQGSRSRRRARRTSLVGGFAPLVADCYGWLERAWLLLPRRWGGAEEQKWRSCGGDGSVAGDGGQWRPPARLVAQ